MWPHKDCSSATYSLCPLTHSCSLWFLICKLSPTVFTGLLQKLSKIMDMEVLSKETKRSPTDKRDKDQHNQLCHEMKAVY